MSRAQNAGTTGRTTRLAMAMCLALGTLSVTTVLLPTAAAIAADAKGKVSAKVGVPLKAAQDAVNAGQFDTALAKIKEAQAVEPRTDFDNYQIDEFLSFVLIKQSNYAEAAPVYERMVNSGLMPPEQVNDRLKAIAKMYYQTKDYAKAADAAKKYVDKNPGDEEMEALLAQSYYLADNFSAAKTAMGTLIGEIEQKGQTPKEAYLNFQLSSNVKLKDDAATLESLKKMVRYYPSDKYWENLLDIYRHKTSSDRVVLGYYRLMSEVGVLKQKGDYLEMAQLSTNTGLPGESAAILQKGTQSGLLKTADKKEQARIDAALADSTRLATADKASLPQLAKDAEKSPKGQADVALGQAYASYGQTDDAIAALQRGIKKGGVTDADEANLSLGIAYLKKGQKDQARQAFETVKGDSKWHDLAQLWLLRVQAPAASATPAA
jgi:Flp pilus assembly protein TadD